MNELDDDYIAAWLAENGEIMEAIVAEIIEHEDMKPFGQTAANDRW